MVTGQDRAKRRLDIVLASLMLAACLPVIAACVLLVWLADGRPVFFRQIREGRHGVHFGMWKIRTMRNDAEACLERWLEQHPERRAEWEAFRRIEGDPRIIPAVGWILRRASLDELPQLWNVLKGDMSLVGPRPLEPGAVAQLPTESLALRRSVRPGITGLWQVSGRSELSIAAAVEIDNHYIRSWNLTTDLYLLLCTPGAVLSGRGAY
jgi:lipopolysaccharide/colanic/teichoic acid biosynthesis glycosyltransferase